ncbi:MAG: hypothetical protein CSA58_07465 [Micrococcales bacterium]|nr:MAG: hypothetical protein CSB46_08770 [Micrococcales bacterium]PIE26831.1 MAG: hypothetical protein CSA58_07465 [Micrococcales bacterium]
MSEQEFDEAVDAALDSLPAEIMDRVDNVAILVAADPPEDQPNLLGLYEGVPLTHRGVSWVLSQPDRITIFRNPILARCWTGAQVRHEVRVTVLHELGHYFGIGEDRLHELGWG